MSRNIQLQFEDIRVHRDVDNDFCRLKSPPTITDQRVFQLKQNDPEELPSYALRLHNIEIAWIFLDTCAHFFKENMHEAKEFILSVLTVDIMNQLWSNIGYEESYEVYIVGCYFSQILSDFRAFILPHIIQTLEEIGYLGLGGRLYVKGNNLVYKKNMET
ncbi:1428_t:CDS:2 [Funneliformis caledonium]|uniref:1428_t:CDS:1 n=1 Tax=Funneliformis caledonium TaxID=1117310 RepID=A0A9N9AES1_9GLOM|nr:1428_t:CDS:2 [Funneliformis caledonium]